MAIGLVLLAVTVAVFLDVLVASAVDTILLAILYTAEENARRRFLRKAGGKSVPDGIGGVLMLS